MDAEGFGATLADVEEIIRRDYPAEQLNEVRRLLTRCVDPPCVGSLHSGSRGGIINGWEEQVLNALQWIRRRLKTRGCKACGERYSRKLPNCPTCKTLPGHDGIDRGGDWGHGVDLPTPYT